MNTVGVVNGSVDLQCSVCMCVCVLAERGEGGLAEGEGVWQEGVVTFQSVHRHTHEC